jgi:5-methylthioadenosine/S-adenosylhomocysteine deaminase
LGLVVGLGTDGCSSSNDLDMWAVIRLAAQMVSLSHSPAEVDLRRIIRAATIDGAVAVGMGDRVGSIEIGKEADLLMLDLSALHLIPIHNVMATLVFAAGRGDVTDVWVRGERVVNDRKLVKVDSTALKIRVEERMKALDPFR